MANRRMAEKKSDRAIKTAAPTEAKGSFLRSRWMAWLLVPLMALLSPLLLGLSFAPADAWPLAFVALVPWVLALTVGPKRWWGMLWAYLAGLIYWIASIYWIWWVDQVGYAACIAYLSLYWLLAAFIIRAALRRNWPAWIVLPIVWVALEYARVYVISGFPWFFLSQTQYQQVRLIQLADVTGEFGISFFVAMANGAIVDLLRGPILVRSPQGRRRFAPRCLAAVAAVLLTAAGMLVYGSIRLGQAPASTSQGPVIGLVQQAFPNSLKDDVASGEKILADHIASSQTLIGANCDLVVWPETMLPKGLNPEFINANLAVIKGDDLRSLANRLISSEVWDRKYSEAFLRNILERIVQGRDSEGYEIKGPSLRDQGAQLGELSRQLGCPILAGGATVHRTIGPLNSHDLWSTRNSALLFDRQGIPTTEYSKIHLVPFGEYVPFKNSWVGLHKYLRSFVPPVMEQLEPGSRYEYFTIRPRQNPGSPFPASAPATMPAPTVARDTAYTIATPICYEGVFARLCRDMVYSEGRKKVDILANISNDGWFVHNQKGSTEQSQHLAQYVFRAIENRVPVVRAVNTGISGSIDSDGRILAQVQQYGLREMAVGSLVLDGQRQADGQYLEGHGPRVLVDNRLSVYSRVGDLFAQALALAAIGMTAWLWWKRKDSLNGDTK